MRLVSPSLPIGSYTWSQGLETAIERNWVRDKDSALDWMKAILLRSMTSCEGPILLRLYDAYHQHDDQQFDHWNTTLLAMRETMELRNEDLEQGELLIKIAKTHDHSFLPLPISYTFAAAFAVICQLHHIDRNHSLLGFLWIWVESQVATITKLIPLGFRDSQFLLGQLTATIYETFSLSEKCVDNDLGYSMVGRSLASSWHENQYCRIFRS